MTILRTTGKVGKNYSRNCIKKLFDITAGLPIIVSAKYKDSDNPKWATFTCVRPYIPGCKTATLCSHINIDRDSVKRWHGIGENYHNRKFYIVGYPCLYMHYGDERAAIRLAEDLIIKPIIFNSEQHLLDEVVAKCYHFNPEGYGRSE